MPKQAAKPRRKRRGTTAETALQGAVTDAVRFLIDTMQDPGEKTEVRLRCAAQVLDRACPPQEDGTVEVRLEDPEGFSL